MTIRTVLSRLLGSRLVLTLCCLLVAPVQVVQCQSPASGPSDLVSQNLLKLLHAPEVHQELKLTESQVRLLEQFFGQIDGAWFRSRNLPADKQRVVVQELEDQAWGWIKQHVGPPSVTRLKQILYRSQGGRMLLTPEVIDAVKLDTNQTDKLKNAAKNAQTAQQNLEQAMSAGSAVEEAQKEVQEAAEKERGLVTSLLNKTQLAKISELRGKDFDTQSLQRIYPMAPELMPAANWINSQPLKLAELRGKVVLLHFYAFQCHNCHANFDHYKRWYKQYGDKDVVVIGIQTPETSAEADAKQVLAAAKERSFEFPVLVDLDKKNWDSWGNTMWPTVYVIDQQGYLRHWWQGELNWQGAKADQQIEKVVDQLLHESTKARG